jgi:uncharacterized membrane protein YjjP (DUF1212 family)
MKASPKSARVFLLRLAQALHKSGFPSGHLEGIVGSLEKKLGVRANLVSLPTAMMGDFGEGEKRNPFILRVEPGEMDLEKQVALHDTARALSSGRISLASATRRVAAIESAKSAGGTAARLAAGAVVGAAAARLFGGGWPEMLAALVGGFMVALEARILRGRPASRIFESLAAVSVSLMVALGTLIVPITPTMAVLGGLFMLLPGYTITVALDELAARQMIAGASRLASAITSFLFLGLGLILAGKLAVIFGAPIQTAALAGLPAWTDYAAIVLGLLAFAAWFRAPLADYLPIVVAGGAGVAVQKWGSVSLGGPLAAFTAALVVSISANIYARISGRLAAVVIAPAILLMVPGSLGLKSILFVASRDVVIGVDAALQMALGAIALVTGVLAGNLVQPLNRRN